MYGPDRDLALRETALPALALLLDPATLLARLRAAIPEIGADSVRVTYLRHKPGTSCIAGIELDGPAGVRRMYARALRASDRDKLAKIAARASSTGLPHFVLEGADTIVCPFPLDLALPSLPALMGDSSRRELLEKVLGRDSTLLDAPIAAVHHRPERRFVARLGTGPGSLGIKLHEAAAFGLAKSNAKRLMSTDALRIPRMLGRSHRHRMVVQEWLDGPVLAQALRRRDFDVTRLQEVGVALRRLHRRSAASLRPRGRHDEARAVWRLAAYLGHLRPHHTSWLRDIAGGIVGALEHIPEVGYTTHGDFHPGQVVLTATGVAVIDLDEAAAGDPATDVGTFLAHVTYESMSDPSLAARYDAIRDAILEGYGRPRKGAPPLRSELATAVALFRLAPQPFRLRDPAWAERIDAVLSRVEELLAAVGSERITRPAAEPQGATPWR